MERYFHLIGDKMPNSSQIHLPSWEVQKDIYARYCQDKQIRGIPEDEVAGISVTSTKSGMKSSLMMLFLRFVHT